ncbi:hypothetical protein OHB44_30895 [Micromonospora sp. NBC_00821]|uniref:hypothetical protein n=1 Tax=Micromonospora sp. NBC_00821 TaxID=2975977 RepID=UPI002ED11DAF|nr:hypothetical protein OHB44_30895 [Micromonospora sp. NBC_00821]
MTVMTGAGGSPGTSPGVVAEGTVKSWLHRGRTALAGLLDESTEGMGSVRVHFDNQDRHWQDLTFKNTFVEVRAAP